MSVIQPIGKECTIHANSDSYRDATTEFGQKTLQTINTI